MSNNHLLITIIYLTIFFIYFGWIYLGSNQTLCDYFIPIKRTLLIDWIYNKHLLLFVYLY